MTVEIAALRARVAELERQTADLRLMYSTSERCLAETCRQRDDIVRDEQRVRGERDALRAWVSAVSEALGAIEPVSDCRVELNADAAAALAESLRAQVEAARAECKCIAGIVGRES